MSKINYQKVLDQILKEHPHEIESIKKVIGDSKGDARLDLKNILENKEWNADEIYELITFKEINPYEVSIKDYDLKKHGYVDYNAFTYLLNNDLKEGFIACLRRFFTLDRFYIGHYIGIEKAYQNLISKIYKSTLPFDKKVEYLAITLENTPEHLLEKEIRTNFIKNDFGEQENTSIFYEIVKSKDLNLIEKYSSYLNDPHGLNLYLNTAIKTGDISVVKYFLENGADPNFLYEDPLLGYLTPIKMAIKCNNYEIYKILKEYGAKVTAEAKKEKLLDEISDSKKNSKELNRLKFLRYSTPLDYATELSHENVVDKNVNHWYDVNFYDSCVAVDYNSKTSNVLGRSSIIDDIYESIKDKTKINFTNLLISTLAIRSFDLFKKYANYVINNAIKVDLMKIIDSFFDFQIQFGEDKERTITLFLDFLEKCSDNNVCQKMLQTYYFRQLNSIGRPCINIDLLTNELLKRIPESKRISVPLISHVADLESVKVLEGYGYDINQIDEDGYGIFYNLLEHVYPSSEFNKSELVLIDYLLDKVDLSKEDKDGHNILYYMMKKFDTKDEYQYNTHSGPKNNTEDVLVKLIKKMKKEDVLRSDISEVLDKRVTDYDDRNYGHHMDIRYIYQHHQALFDALIEKEFVFSDTFYDNLYDEFFSENGLKESLESYLKVKTSLDKTIEYIFEKVDRNTEVQKLDIRSLNKEILEYLDSKDANFEEFIRLFINFNNKIVELSEFYNNNILKRYDPERYLEYAEKRYQTTYTGFNDMLLRIIIKAIIQFPEEDIDTILSIAPTFDINHKVLDMDTDYSYWQYFSELYPMVESEEEEGLMEESEAPNRFEASNYQTTYEDKLKLNGGLVQFAIFKNDLDLVKRLVSKGATLKYMREDEDCSFDYVNSDEMQDYLESILGKRSLADLDEEDKNYYLSLLG